VTTYLSPATLAHVSIEPRVAKHSNRRIVVDPFSRALPARAMLDVERWMTRYAMDDALDDLRTAADREFQIGLLELEVATANYSEHVALTLAGFCLARDDIPAALAVLRGWARNPRRTTP
jgi:hypothetical protein